jgi:hypothetical protein
MSGTGRREQIEGLAGRVEELSFTARVLLTVLFGAGGIACLVLGRLIVLHDGLASWFTRLLLFEPAGLLGVLAGSIVAFPRSRLSCYLSTSLARRKYLSAAFVTVSLVVIFEGVRWFVSELLQTRPW